MRGVHRCVAFFQLLHATSKYYATGDGRVVLMVSHNNDGAMVRYRCVVPYAQLAAGGTRVTVAGGI